jgi:uncharacterized protein
MNSFILFLSGFLIVYGLVHVYAYVKLRSIFLWGKPWSFAAALVLIVLLFLPVAGRVLEVHGPARLSVPVLFAGYGWMALVFLFISAQAGGDLIRLVFPLFSPVLPPAVARPFNTARPVAVAAASAALLAFVYGHFEARRIGVHHMELHTEKLPPGLKGLRVVQISDLHFSPLQGPGLARRVTGRIRELDPDILVATGDLVDRIDMARADEITRLFASLEAPLGKYAVTGNHEFYGEGIDEVLGFMESAGFRVLRGEVLSPLPGISVAGIDDEASVRFGGPEGEPLDALLDRVPSGDLVLVLRHRPKVDEAHLGRFDLQLSGHTHGGQIFPFGVVVGLVHRYSRGEYDLGKGSTLYVNRGGGTWGPPVRVGSPPEITLVEILPGP